MRIGIYKDTLANRRGADAAVLALADGLRERGYDALVFEKKDFEKRIKEPWDVIISTGTNELLDLASRWGHRALPLPIRNSPTPPLPHFPWPIIQQFHTNPKSQFKWKRFLRNWKIKRALKCVCAIQVLSEEFVPQVKKYGAPVHVIGNWSKYSSELSVESLEFGVLGSEFNDPQSNSQLKTPPLTHSTTPPPTIIYPAAFAKGKNQKLLIKAFAKVSAEFPEWRLRLLGHAKGRYAEECWKLAEKIENEFELKVGVGGKGRIEFTGFCENIDMEYEQCAFVAFPSLDEGFPLTVVDAAAFAKPCVMVKDWIGTGGGLELKVGVGGIVTKPTVEAYAEGLRRLMADSDLRRQMGERAREFCAEHYSREKILDKWEELVKKVVCRNCAEFLV